MTPRTRAAASVIIWTLVCLVAADLLVGWLTGRLSALKGPAHPVVRYFDYGRSTEDKLTDVVRDPTHPGNAVFRAGWLDLREWRSLPDRPSESGGKLVAVYGQSFAFHLADIIAQTGSTLTFRKIGGPGAPLNHSYAAYRMDKERHKADAVVVGVLASSFCKIGTVSGLALSFEMPSPYTFPGFRLQDGRLTETLPALQTEQEFRQALGGGTEQWQKFRLQYAQTDPAYDDFKFRASSLDGSVLTRLIRRGWVASRTAEWQEQRDEDGIQTCVREQLPVAAQMLSDWQLAARERGEPLIVVLFQDRGYDRVLTRTLLPMLERSGIQVLDSADTIDSADPAQFLADGHFTPIAERRMAAALKGMLP